MPSTWGISWGTSWLNSWGRNAVIIPTEPAVALSGGPFATEHRSVHWEPIKKSKARQDDLEMQILREDGELIAAIIALC